MNKKKSEDKNHQEHSITIKGLNPGAKYYFRIQAKDVYGQSDSRRVIQLTLPELKKTQPKISSMLKAAKTNLKNSEKNDQQKELGDKGNNNQNSDSLEKLNSENQENQNQAPQEQNQKFEEKQTSQKKSFVWWNPSTWF